MDNLKLQTVYVPVEGDLDNRPALCFWYDDEDNEGWQYQTDLDKQANRIVLTPGELLALIDEFDDSKYMSATNFLKSKGIEICDNTSLGRGIK